ncbi:hypothetical protein WICANDRAFT_83310 [Wickerhamomyces anomalus NRRL Y-366-8]|uniref:GPI transamidase component GAB1 n=1 Tax=Wickerhamomyces anomalus (strain ATCC 58044 / CBS 1984 / NCYC 433 / NRRL Y-366-8) TaxID=683960 RepID=A0A1E3P809_WICAA|nr:uncharacterized protein WICANDRAFT_83310 [Wickerhamomyces anomalus NRRL Y-366-8]ODQ61072.1 hypothetical protein WICANDRAFT_83310 [Wickerhamomyces anomalus NRRL Y-366-8]
MLSLDKKVIILAFVIRFGIFIIAPSIANSLEESIEFSTLITSYKSLKEGLFLYSSNINPYDGGVVHHQPLLIILYQYFQDFDQLLYSIVDTYIVYYLINISAKISSKNETIFFKPWIVGLIYALNPLAILSTLSKSTVLFQNFFIVWTLNSALNNDVLLTGVGISIASYLSYHPIFLVIPLIKLIHQNNNGQNQKVWLFLVSAVISLGLLIGSSFYILGQDWKFIESTYGSVLKFTKIAPNLGLWWYYFTEMFEFFIPFYNSVFNLYNISFVLPLTIRLNGIFAFILSWGWLVFSKSYPSLGDLSLYISLLFLLKPVFPFLRYPVISILLLLHSIILSPIFYHLWIDLGSGNSNFFYAITLVYSLGIISTLVDFTWGYLRYEYDSDESNIKLKVTQI